MAFFSKVLGMTDVEKQMAVPSHFMEHLPDYEGGHTQYFPVVDLSGKVWRFGYFTRKITANNRHSKPAFQGEWHQFVTEKKLDIGDQIIFRMEMDDNGAPRYTIAAQKPARFKLFGQVIWGPEF